MSVELMLSVVYVSSATRLLGEDELREILCVSRCNNVPAEMRTYDNNGLRRMDYAVADRHCSICKRRRLRIVRDHQNGLPGPFVEVFENLQNGF